MQYRDMAPLKDQNRHILLHVYFCDYFIFYLKHKKSKLNILHLLKKKTKKNPIKTKQFG